MIVQLEQSEQFNQVITVTIVDKPLYNGTFILEPQPLVLSPMSLMLLIVIMPIAAAR
jgi:hypothetical protein